ncbi:YkgJ family cysteine cluster protein [Desulforhopalus singaporensis]|uniref:Uncharacterized protein n=1 Tax=Desulforhopalus singaporensis TaxID=91360 RepID=A0A1H0L9G5_9BACT|nr:YkgJ family cysteine cluster protein [Desulforhopalus singaporensis]SDO64874.1 hypothetical protein SAMN05660330_00714 [Desulforhopalus singaporensis]
MGVAGWGADSCLKARTTDRRKRDNHVMTYENGKTGGAGKNRRFCNYCPGFCCYRLPGATLYLDGDDINRIARHFGIEDGEVRKRYLEGRNTFKTDEHGACVFLLDGRLSKRCSIHTARPRQCRDFPYQDPCPYLERVDLLEEIYPRVEANLKKHGVS